VPDPSPSRTAGPWSGLPGRVRWLFLLVGAVNLAILLVAVLLGGRAGWPLRAVAVAAVAGLAGLWVAGHLVGDTLRRHQQGAARERLLSSAGAALFSATGPAAIHRTAVTAAVRLAGSDQRLRACLFRLEQQERELLAVAAEGDRAGEPLGRRVPLASMPAALRLGLLERRTVYAERQQAAGPLAFEPKRGAVLQLPLPTRDGLWGVLTVASEGPIPVDARDALEALRAQVALALERAALTADLRRRASFDPLTELANRGRFRERLQQALGRPDGGRPACAVLLLDLDDFKTVNDSLGNLAGDQVLQVVAERLRACVRAGDTPARLGGDEFAVLLAPVGDQAQAVAAAERILAALAAPVPVAGRQLQLRASMGIRLGGRGEQPDEVLRDADLAMYLARERSRGTYQVFDQAMHADAVRRQAAEADLRRAVAEERFTVRYQPIIELASGRLAGLEALVRWQHPQRGLVPPADFIPLAEQTGLIVPIGSFVLRTACRAARDWQRRYPMDLPPFMSVNLSVVQLLEADPLEEVTGVLDACGLDPADLVLEITESVLVIDADATIERLRALRGLGVHLAIDDFGTGYSSLAYLRRLPVDTLKLAKPFVDGLTRGIEEAALAHAIVRLGDTLSLRVVAEGVEDEDQALELQALGCEFGQGYLFARPLDQAGVERLLRVEQRRQRRVAAPKG
jgi:diguanylate cyclase (GGDEF)-like protein